MTQFRHSKSLTTPRVYLRLVAGPVDCCRSTAVTDNTIITGFSSHATLT